MLSVAIERSSGLGFFLNSSFGVRSAWYQAMGFHRVYVRFVAALGSRASCPRRRGRDGLDPRIPQSRQRGISQMGRTPVSTPQPPREEAPIQSAKDPLRAFLPPPKPRRTAGRPHRRRCALRQKRRRARSPTPCESSRECSQASTERWVAGVSRRESPTARRMDASPG